MSFLRRIFLSIARFFTLCAHSFMSKEELSQEEKAKQKAFIEKKIELPEQKYEAYCNHFIHSHGPIHWKNLLPVHQQIFEDLYYRFMPAYQRALLNVASPEDCYLRYRLKFLTATTVEILPIEDMFHVERPKPTWHLPLKRYQAMKANRADKEGEGEGDGRPRLRLH